MGNAGPIFPHTRCRAHIQTHRGGQASRRTTRPAANYIEVLTYLVIACQQVAIWRCRPSRPRITGYVIYPYRTAEAVVPPATNTLPLKAPDAEP